MRCSDSHFSQGASELVGAAGGFVATKNALEAFFHLAGFLAANESTDAFEVSVASSHELHVLNAAFIVEFDVDEARAGALCGIGEMFSHVATVYSGFMLV